MEIKLVVLDDDKDDLSLMETYLTRFGYKAKYFNEVDEFEKSLDAMPTIIVTDYYLGGRTGVDMMRKVKDKHPICTFIIVSSQMSVTQLIDIVNVGWGCYYINKGNGEVDKFIKELCNRIDGAFVAMEAKLKGFLEMKKKEDEIKRDAFEMLQIIDQEIKKNG